MKTKWQKIKDEILNSPKWLVSLDINDIVTLTSGNDNNINVLEASTMCSSDERFNILVADIFNQYNTTNLMGCNPLKMLVFVQFPISFPIMMAEMNSINKLIDNIIGENMNCEIKWGLSPREDKISRIVCVFSPVL